MMRILVLGPVFCAALTACGLQPVPESAAPLQGIEDAPSGAQTRPVARPAGLNTVVARPPAGANTAEALDTTTPEQRAAAAAVVPAAPSRELGKTIVSLGSPTEPGFWLKTPLVKSETAGRVTNPANGQSAAVTLIPIDGPETAGSRMSLPAMRLIGLSLTDLTEVSVARDG